MRLSLISEGWGRTVLQQYTGKQVTDPRPNALVLGRYVNHKGTPLLMSINLNYLNDEQVLRLRTNLSGVLQDRNARRRVRMIRSIMPDIFNAAYRTYNSDAVNIIKPGTLKFFKPQKEADVEGDQAQKPPAPLPIGKPEDVPAAKTAPAAQGKAVPGAPGAIEGQDAKADTPSTGNMASKVKARNDDLRGDTKKKEEEAAKEADLIRRGQIKKELEDKLKDEIEKDADGKIGTDDLDDAFEEGEGEQDGGPR